MSIERKLRRAQAHKLKKEAEKELATKIALFGQLPNKCLTCEKSFDKLDREQVMSWNVIVSEKKEQVRLYCPECWEGALNLIKKTKEELLNRKKENE